LWLKLRLAVSIGEIIYAINVGGDSFTDSHGIRYRKDYATFGTSSDYGRALDIKRVSGRDKELYQTERYDKGTFGYKIPMPSGDGSYVLWLKFSEVWFNAADLKVFDVALNDVVIISNLDIYEKVGRGVAHDETFQFQISQNKITINGRSQPFSNEISVDFIKTQKDNPKVNAIILMKGTIDQVPQLPAYKIEKPLDDFDDEYEDADSYIDDSESNDFQKSGKSSQESDDSARAARSEPKKPDEFAAPRVADPYASDDSSYFIPILVAIGAFIPLLFCLCKL